MSSRGECIGKCREQAGNLHWKCGVKNCELMRCTVFEGMGRMLRKKSPQTES